MQVWEAGSFDKPAGSHCWAAADMLKEPIAISFLISASVGGGDMPAVVITVYYLLKR
jgi:hypothetical protein